ncbi:eukaryotic translation initiation factor 4G1-domain-containing protein, partial [Pisolithus croceorrhizus]
MTWPYHFLDYASPWYRPTQRPHDMGHTPHDPGPTSQGPPRPGIALSPRTQPPPLAPGTPSMTHAIPHSPHTPQPPLPHAHQPSPDVSMPPPPTPSTSTAPGGRSLNSNTTTFHPTSSRSHKITIKSPDGKEVKLKSLIKTSPQLSTTPIPLSAPITKGRRTASVRFESKRAKWKREEQARIEQERQEAEERSKQGEEERKRKEEEAANRGEEEKQEEKREGKEGEQERAHKAEEEKLRQEEERKCRLEEERCMEEHLRVEIEREERERREREQAELDERERTEGESEQQRQEEGEAETRKDGVIVEFPTQMLLEVEDGKMIDNGEVLEPQINGASDLSQSQKESSRIDTSKFVRRQPSPTDINAAKEDISAPPLSALLTARKINRLDEVEYPEGIRSPKADLNENAKDGKFRYDRGFLLQFMTMCKEKPPNLSSRDIFGLEPVDES